ncbi:hypothetical protein PA7_44640 [Pseudonocardia asaccharolytica DSM 44247 = NBRC 16224]|uniref:Luciferase-like domain-containing protein n=1 Tax=Pseudonocardia asaccharolytica DSM 44247 = NBRC 16224 TaxID=1123024 RepID=A0A511D7N9_9PSEU|nr:hypothetical protein PA7_44640 [Pseudonocardia asaccharolytica DSM 44247 = NBRC 16224]
MSDLLGISLPTRTGLSARELGSLARRAEQAGYAAVFLAEGGSDVLALCPAVIEATERVVVGTAIANAHLRPPALAAMTAATLDEQSGGRFVLGLGVATPALNHHQLGLPRVPPLAMLRDYVGVVRAVHRGETYDGPVYRLAAPLPLDRPPARPRVPVYLAALRPRMAALAGEIADGVVLNLMSPQQAAAAVRTVRSAPRPTPVATRTRSRSAACSSAAWPRIRGARRPRPGRWCCGSSGTPRRCCCSPSTRRSPSWRRCSGDWPRETLRAPPRRCPSPSSTRS